MDILRIATAGSVDDGKSTLIGRLLFETQSITKDKIEALKTASQRKGLDFVDLSLLTDGLIAEREQGITIDVAHIYFNTPTRKYIIADTPGHFEYTRNMVTGASNASVSIILIDARNGVGEQTRRHFYISSLLEIKNVVVAVNKMDLVDYDENRFNEIKSDFFELSDKVRKPNQNITFIPISSLYGENIVTQSEKMNWYEGNSLLQILEGIAPEDIDAEVLPFRFPVQQVIRPKSEEYHDFRGYAGKIASGQINKGDLVTALPSQQISKVKEILKYDLSLNSAHQTESVVITLEDDIDISRGNMLVKVGEQPELKKQIDAKICWMDTDAMKIGKTYLIQHGVNRVKAKISAINSRLEISTFEESENVDELNLNQIGVVSFKLGGFVFSDNFEANPANGAFIIIDEFNNNTVGVGFVL
ncbi:sulfate adenylyltransferase [Lacihabitans sp. LS3-19]|uniref:sulfate adenylyltransferase subunit 1 n=1 Tax=Lacihabitans sp. LS3-19 TaxID=2487335 RepID=UPI0020CEB036|nr:GTP-binding protein [Lacihabitans sp. LS3-19]MCP9767021.1 sulfate adenylyltransferase [Lacihabitans sp. LS3-19]